MADNNIYASPICSCIICKKIFSQKGIHSHFLQNHDVEFKSDWEEKNKNSINRKLTCKENEIYKWKEYYKSPNICTCGNEKDWFRRNNKFCSQSCAAQTTNKMRLLTEESNNNRKKKISNTLKRKHENKEIIINPNNIKHQHTKKVCAVSFFYCKTCNKLCLSKSKTPSRKTCSLECSIHCRVGNRTYTNGRRLNIYHFNKFDGTTVLLESSWEEKIAKFLDDNNISWIRPKYIKWVDDNGKQRLYYPDFLLVESGQYLDPKNPTALSASYRKMEIVSSIIPIWIGDVDVMISKINLVRGEGFEPTTQFLAPVPKTGGIDQTNRTSD